MRVCLITPYDLSADGGVNAHCRGLAEALRRRGDEVVVLGPGSGAVPAGCHGLPGVVPVPANGSTARIGLLIRPSKVLDFLARGRFELVHLHEPLVPGPARMALERSTLPKVATFHAYAEREGALSLRLRKLAAGPLSRVGRAIAVSKPAAAHLGKIWPGPVSIIPNGLTTASFAGEREERSGGPIRVLFVGRFGEPRKGLPVLLEAAEILAARGLRLDLAIAGGGPREKFEARAAKVGVKFLGRLDDAALARAYRSSDLFCAPSLGGESFGIVLAEAMAAGCPVVASDLPGYTEASAGAAELFHTGDAQALAAVLQRLAVDEEARRRLAEKGRARAAELDWDRLAGQIRALYQELLAAPAAEAMA